MGDVYVYQFMRSRGDGRRVVSERRATLEAIKSKGDAVMESQIVVDATEVDVNGFLISSTGSDARPIDQLWSEIRSLEHRANSRDAEALTMGEAADGARKYMLSMESQELRAQIVLLKTQRNDLLVNEQDDRRGRQEFVPFSGGLTTD